MLVAGLALMVLASAGCRQQMDDQPKIEALEAAGALPGNRAAQHPPAGTVPIGDPEAVRGPEWTMAAMQRGRERFEIFCTPCHGWTGRGDGPVVRRGFPSPPSFHSDRLRNAPVEHFAEVIRDGYGVMYSYADRVAPADRWAIAVYVRALQTSQHLDVSDHPELRRELAQGVDDGGR